MGLSQFKSAVKVRKTDYNVAFCIIMKHSEHAGLNRLNAVLENLQVKLRRKSEEGILVKKAFIYRDGHINTRLFDEVSVDHIYYADYVNGGTPLPHAVLRSLMALKEEKRHHEKCRSILYLFIDDVLDRDENARILDMMKAFEDISYIPVLIKEKGIAESSLDRYIIETKGRICYMDDLLDEETVPEF